MTREPAQFPHNLALKRVMAALRGTVKMRVSLGKIWWRQCDSGKNHCARFPSAYNRPHQILFNSAMETSRKQPSYVGGNAAILLGPIRANQ